MHSLQVLKASEGTMKSLDGIQVEGKGRRPQITAGLRYLKLVQAMKINGTVQATRQY
jgi:hypothetical protein